VEKLADIAKSFEEETFEDYAKMLIEIRDNDELILQYMGFSILSLVNGRPPSFELLMRLFPVTEDKQELTISVNLLTELQMSWILNYAEKVENASLQ